MASGWRYRIVSVVGVFALIVAAVSVANHPLVHSGFRLLPVVGHLPFDPAEGREFFIEAGTTAVVVLLALAPLYKPRPHRILDISMFALKRTLVGLFALATIGYFDYTYRLPRATLLIVGSLLVVAIPTWFVTIRSRPARGESGRAIIVGDDPSEIDRILAAIDIPVFGYVSPPSPYIVDTEGSGQPQLADGAGSTADSLTYTTDLECLGGLSRLDDILVEHDIDVAVFAFDETDREEFFGVLATCHEHGVDAKIHRDKADSVLVDDDQVEEIVDIDVEPWDWQERVVKRVFDVVFAAVGLLFGLPLMAAAAVAIKLEDGGTIFYKQERTAEFGDTFQVYKFRSMIPNAEERTGAKLSEEDRGGRDPRVTRVGRTLRKTHLDEIPQLWSILVGDMSVVGPRPERPELDRDIEEGVSDWRRRWFVRPGLTGLAQVNDVTGHEPEQKLRLDVEYIRRQSFWFDLKIAIRQIWKVVSDIAETLAHR
ncbi:MULTISPECIES: sugar transferase [Halomicrobium]|uniref:Exopolysaccharide biosynthesis polyprenyl glycosylphosphotransferase n=2 Tax=Halomicrobium mukohataei TaxID=57705 RepID=C7P399_HALMD|nr:MULTISPECIES: sugar transferase [Halomicrobium]ACV47571.1 exopolysaccharide biosynthesis polyprenyl glycosylphosphotransferase [Halomicrobium mukohataei DSM 12286]QCD66034.1 sugar transferase [Halomicrobium mukohataei]QFR20839.1 sugar transferase [Halomicrobium sp. ZPS1]